MIIPVLAGLGALCLSNPGRRRRRAKKSKGKWRTVTTVTSSRITKRMKINPLRFGSTPPKEKVLQAIRETEALLRKELKYSPDLQKPEYVAFLRKHIETLHHYLEERKLSNPLRRGCSAQAISDNIRELRRAGHKPKQAIAIAMRQARAYKRKCKHLPKSVRYRVNPDGYAVFVTWYEPVMDYVYTYATRWVNNGSAKEVEAARRFGRSTAPGRWVVLKIPHGSGDDKAIAIAKINALARKKHPSLQVRANPGDPRTAVTQRLPIIRATRPLPRDYDPRTASTQRMPAVRSARSNPKGLIGTAADGTRYSMKKNSDTREWMLVAYVNGKRHEGRTLYFDVDSDGKQDAINTFHHLMAQRFNPRRRRRSR